MSAPASWSAIEPRLGRRIVARIVDDAVLVAVAVGISTIAANFADEPGVLQLMARFGGGDLTGPSSVDGAVALAAILVASVLYFLAASASGGRSPGRALARISVIRADGRVPTTRHLLGRELLRVGMLAIAVAVVWPLHHLFAEVVDRSGSYSHVSWFTQAFALWLPGTVVGTLWIAVVLVDPLERAPHDRVAGTRVVGAAPQRQMRR